MQVRPDPISSRPDQDAIGEVIRTKARTFAFAARFLDPERRRATETLYAFFRTVDDLVDERPPASDPRPIGAELDCWEHWLDNHARGDVRRGPSGLSGVVAMDPLKAALARTLATYDIPPVYLRALLTGLREDLAGRPIDTFGDLERYSFRVAATVGLAMCHVLGATTPRALTAATALGIAMQLTNILRDIGDDVARGRVYLPSDELERFGCSPAGLASGSVDEPLRSLLRFQIDRARRYYAAGVLGIDELGPRARYPIALAALLYGRILDKIEAQQYDVFARRAAVSRPEKVALAGRLAIAMKVRPVVRRNGHGADQTPDAALHCLGPAALAELAACGVQVG